MIRTGIVLVNYRNPIDTIECLRSLENTDHSSVKVFLVDNYSCDDSVGILNKFSKTSSLNIELLTSDENRGFASGCNIGILKIIQEGIPWIVLLNNDTTVPRNFTADIFKAQDACPGAVVAGSVTDGLSGKPYPAAGYLNKWTLMIRCDSKDFQMPESDLQFASGCLMVIPTSVFKAVGFLSEEYFMYYEDVEFSLRLKKAGIRIRYWPSIRVEHKTGSSAKKNRLPLHYYGTRNLTYLVLKHGRPYQFITYFLFLCMRIPFQFNRQDRFRDFFMGVFDALTGRMGPRKA